MTTTMTRPDFARPRLARLGSWSQYLAVPLAWSLLPSTQRGDGRVIAALLVFAVGTAFVVAAVSAFDGIAAHADGRDRADDPPGPLATEDITTAEAARFAWAALVAGAVAWTLCAAIAPHALLWMVGLTGLCLATAAQYSRGLRLSYHGWQEVFVGGFGIAVVLCAVGYSHGTVSGFALVQAVIVGLGPLHTMLHANTATAEFDRAIGRVTAATRLTPTANGLLIAGLTVLELSLVVVSAGLGAAPWWFALALTPAMLLRVGQLRHGVGLGDFGAARRLGVRAQWVTVALLIAVNLVGGAR